MNAIKNHIITQLEREILPLQGLKTLPTDNNINLDFLPIENAFPNKSFPVGCMHEFISNSIQDIAATNGFVCGLLSKLMRLGGACVWISTTRTLFPAALKNFGIEPEQIIFIDLKKEKDVLYATEEALKCNKLTAVLGEIKHQFQRIKKASVGSGTKQGNRFYSTSSAKINKYYSLCFPLAYYVNAKRISRWQCQELVFQDGMLNY